MEGQNFNKSVEQDHKSGPITKFWQEASPIKKVTTVALAIVAVLGLAILAFALCSHFHVGALAAWGPQMAQALQLSPAVFNIVLMSVGSTLAAGASLGLLIIHRNATKGRSNSSEDGGIDDSKGKGPGIFEGPGEVKKETKNEEPKIEEKEKPVDLNKAAVWTSYENCHSMQPGQKLRIELDQAAMIHWTSDNWNTTQDTHTTNDAPSSKYYAEITPQQNSGQVIFTYQWKDNGQWLGKNLTVNISSEKKDTLV